VLHDGAAIEIAEGFAQGAGGLRRILQRVEDSATAMVAQRLENPVVLFVV
jgi:hypothetical protein